MFFDDLKTLIFVLRSIESSKNVFICNQSAITVEIIAFTNVPRVIYGKVFINGHAHVYISFHLTLLWKKCKYNLNPEIF